MERLEFDLLFRWFVVLGDFYTAALPILNQLRLHNNALCNFWPH
jgi:hypothetical protein